MIRALLLPFAAISLCFSSPAAAADDCEFIRKGLQAIPAGGGEFVIPAGSYTCATPVVLDRDGQRLRGQGNATVLRLANQANSPVVVMGDVNTPPRVVKNLVVSNLFIDGNREQQDIECWGGPCDSGGTAHIRNNGITVRGIHDSRVENVSITGPRSGGVVTERGTVRFHVNGLTVTDSYFDGLAGYETTESLFENMHLHNNTAAGISIDIRFSGNTIRNSRLINNADVGIFMRDSNQNLFDKVVIEGSGSHGVFLAWIEDSRTCAEGNEFRDLTVTGARGFGFRMNNACHGNRLTGTARFQSNRDGCVSEAEGVRLGIEGSVVCENGRIQ